MNEITKQYLNVPSPARYTALKGINLDGEVQSPMVARQDGDWVSHADYVTLLNVAISMEENRRKDNEYTYNILRELNDLKRAISNLIR